MKKKYFMLSFSLISLLFSINAFSSWKYVRVCFKNTAATTLFKACAGSDCYDLGHNKEVVFEGRTGGDIIKTKYHKYNDNKWKDGNTYTVLANDGSTTPAAGTTGIGYDSKVTFDFNHAARKVTYKVKTQKDICK